MSRISLSVLFVLLACASARAQSTPAPAPDAPASAPGEPTAHFVSKGESGNQPVAPEEMTKRIREAADEYMEYAPIPRIAFIDYAFPRDKAEMKGMAGYALLLVTTFSQEPDELPLKRVYVPRDGRIAELKRITVVASEVSPDERQLRATFGRYRSDALYLLPASFATDRDELLADFSARREGFKLGELAPAAFGPFQKWSRAPAAGAEPDPAVRDAFIRREYPGFFSCETLCGSGP